MGFDDADYMIRAKQAGYSSIIYDGKLEVTHLEMITVADTTGDFTYVKGGTFTLPSSTNISHKRLNAVLHEVAGAVFTIDAQNDTQRACPPKI